jgi:phage terminase small subunit
VLNIKKEIMISKSKKQIQGTFRKDRVKNFATFEPLTEIPQPFAGDMLDKEGMIYFKLVCEALLNNGMLTIADTIPITRAANWYSYFKQAERACQDKGYYQQTKSGYTAKSAHFQVLQDSEKALAAFERNYGVSLLYRLKMEFPEKEDEENSILNL